MLLENNTVGVMCFGLKKTGLKPVIAIPGINKIDDKVWKELASNPSIKLMIEPKNKRDKVKLTVIREPITNKKDFDTAEKESKEEGVHIDLAGWTDEECQDVIGNTLFLPLLKDWYDETTRPKIQRLLIEQIDVAGPTAVKEKQS